MTWFLLSLTAALGLATADALTKRFFSDLAPYRMGVVRILSTAPWMVLALLFLPAAVPDRTFWLAIAAALPLELAAFFLYMRALKLSPLSLSLPFLAFTPVFMILTGRLILDEALTAGGVLGILLIVLGAYVLNLSKMKSGLLGPIRAVIARARLLDHAPRLVRLLDHGTHRQGGHPALQPVVLRRRLQPGALRGHRLALARGRRRLRGCAAFSASPAPCCS